MPEFYKISPSALDQLFNTRDEANVVRFASELGLIPTFVSKNQAAKIVGGKVNLEKYIKQGRLKKHPNGNGKTSTVLFERAELIKLRDEEKVVVVAPFVYMTMEEAKLYQKI